MRIVEYEIKRYVVRVKEFRQKMDDCKLVIDLLLITV